MLWTDRRLPITQSDLNCIDSEIAQIIEVEKVPANRILAQAVQEAANAVASMLQAAGPIIYPGGLTSGHMMAVMTTSSAGSLQGVNAPRAAMTNIVLSSSVPQAWSAVKTWLGYRCLSTVMRDVCERRDVDRYKVKWDRIESHLAATAEPMLRNGGMPVVGFPLTAPAAQMEPDVGFWDREDVTLTDLAGTQGGAFDVAVTWTGSSYNGQRERNNGESYHSVPVPITVPPANALAVSIARLIPPDGKQKPPYVGLGAILQPAVATGWNLWVGKRGGPLILQNAEPFPLATQQYVFDGDPEMVGFGNHEGQYSEGNIMIFRAFFRA